ncbi:MAG: HAD family hydrolase [Myxococcales bacterium]|nr:HAD family hydrolase [Myxococcales bacterium]
MTLPTQPSVVLFDIDGTLVSLGGVGRAAMQRAMTEEWGIADPLAGVSFAGATDGGVAARVGGERPRDGVWRRYLHYLSGLLGPGRGAPLPGVVRLLDALSERGVALGLLTGNLSGSARLKLEHVGLWSRFELGYCAFAEDHDDRRVMAERAVERCGGASVVIIGDSASDVSAAKHVGVPVLITTTGPQSREELEVLEPDHLVSDLTDTSALVEWLTLALSATKLREPA